MRTVDEIDALLPQTQCTRCGYDGCRPYAEAITQGEAEINQCPPGGTATIIALARLVERAAMPLNPANGVEGPPLVALIDKQGRVVWQDQGASNLAALHAVLRERVGETTVPDR